MSVILGSASPRRKEILGYFSLPFRTISPDFDESQVPYKGDPEAYVKAVSEKKNEKLREKHPNETLITADTIVYCEGSVYGKPKDQQHAEKILSQLSGKWHSVYTAVHINEHDQVEETKVLFHQLTGKQIQKYIEDFETHDKAAAYAVQGAGNIIVNRIEGCFYNVMGLPINTLYTLLKRVNIDLWDYLK